MGNFTDKALLFLVNSALNQFEKNNQNITPTQQEYIRILRNMDVETGISTANNLCSTMRETREQAVNEAAQFFHI